MEEVEVGINDKNEERVSVGEKKKQVSSVNVTNGSGVPNSQMHGRIPTKKRRSGKEMVRKGI